MREGRGRTALLKATGRWTAGALLPLLVVPLPVGRKGAAPPPPAALHAALPEAVTDGAGAPAGVELFGGLFVVEPSTLRPVRAARTPPPAVVGIASWYGEELAGAPTASGEPYDPGAFTAAHRSYPFSTWVEVKNLANGRTVVVRVNDRGPFAENERRLIDLSQAAARALGMVRTGTARVSVRPVPPPVRETPHLL